MFSLKSSPSTESILSMYGTFAASAMLVRTVVSELQAMASQLVPGKFRTILLSKFEGAFWWWGNPSRMTLLIDEYEGFMTNHLYEAAEIYLAGKGIASSANSLKVFKAPGDEILSLKINKNENITDIFDEIQLNWQLLACKESNEPIRNSGKDEKRVIELSFHKKYTDKVVNSYLPYVMERANAVKQEKEVLKLYSLQGGWESTNLDHPATFETLAMDPTLKKELVDDLDRFIRRKDFYRRVGKAWKRGYLLHGPPGTGKSSLIAAMANYLKFSIYDLELSSIYGNSDLRRVLVSTENRSILVIEDIDCSIQIKDRSEDGDSNNHEDRFTLSGLLNFVDGLWSSCGHERVIVFTTNHKDKLDPALLRPGRMDLHIHMSYCTPSGFRILASNYLGIDSHNLFTQIDELLKEVEVTPAEVAEELMRSEDADAALSGLIKFLQNKKRGSCKLDPDGEHDEDEVSMASMEEPDRTENISNTLAGGRTRIKS